MGTRDKKSLFELYRFSAFFISGEENKVDTSFICCHILICSFQFPIIRSISHSKLSLTTQAPELLKCNDATFTLPTDFFLKLHFYVWEQFGDMNLTIWQQTLAARRHPHPRLSRLSFGSRVPPTAEGLLQEQSHVQGQVVLQLPGHHLHAQREPLLTQTQRALGDRQPQDVDYTWRKK